MRAGKHSLFRALFIAVAILTVAIGAAAQELVDQPRADVSVLLPDSLGGLKASGEVTHFLPNQLVSLVGKTSPVYGEYHIVSALSRTYDRARVDLFVADTQFAAYGLFSFHSKGAAGDAKAIGFQSQRSGDSLIFQKGSFFVRLTGKRPQDLTSAATALADLIPASESSDRPQLMESLPQPAGLPGPRLYFLGPQALGSYVGNAADIYDFDGHAEAVLSQYPQTGATGGKAEPLNLLIIEYHTPQFAHDAFAQLERYEKAMDPAEQAHWVVRREGNYIVQAVNVHDPNAAHQLVDSVKYPYKVKWLQNPLLATLDPFRGQKAARIVLSSFGIVGLLIVAGVLWGSICGAIIFWKRRRRQQELFSDAGGMLTLNLEASPMPSNDVRLLEGSHD